MYGSDRGQEDLQLMDLIICPCDVGHVVNIEQPLTMQNIQANHQDTNDVCMYVCKQIQTVRFYNIWSQSLAAMAPF